MDLRQLSINWKTGRFYFDYTDAALTRELSLEGAPAEADFGEGFSAGGMLLAGGTPGFDIGLLKVGPKAAAKAMEKQYPGIEVAGMTLFVEGCDLAWRVFGQVPEGFYSGRVSNSSGIFEPVGPDKPIPPPDEARP